MKYTKDKNCIPLDQMVYKKIQLVISINGELGGEVIWSKIDSKNQKIILQNHAVMFEPLASWGLVLDLKELRGDKYLDVTHIRNQSPNEVEFKLHYEAYDMMRKQNFIDEKGYITDLFFEEKEKQISKLKEVQEKEDSQGSPQSDIQPQLKLII